MHTIPRQDFRGEILRTRRVADFSLITVAYAPNLVLPLHSHQHAYVSVALSGSYIEQRRMGSTEYGAGGTVFHVPGEPHQNRFCGTGARFLVLEMEPRFFTSLADRGIETRQPYALTNPYCMQLGLRLDRSLRLSDQISALCAEGLCLELLSEALRPGLREPSRPPDWLSRVREILRDRYRERLTLNDLAGEVHIHPVHLARAFRKKYRCCVGEFIRNLRVEAACHELLHSDAPIAEIAARTGFTDQSHLSRVLKRHAGMSPGEFRNARRGTVMR